MRLQHKVAIVTGGARGIGLDLHGEIHLTEDGSRVRGFQSEKGELNVRRKIGKIFLERAAKPAGIDKSALPIGEARRYRDKTHLKFVASQPCLICGRLPCDPHHIRFAQKRALGRKVSDEFSVPLCRLHHRELHRSGNEARWWTGVGIDPLKIARGLWKKTRLPSPSKLPKESAQAPDAARP